MSNNKEIRKSNEQKIREAFEKHCNGDEQYFDEVSFTAGYLALLNALELADWNNQLFKTINFYVLPEGVEQERGE